MNSFILQYMLKYGDSYEYIEKFCFKHKSICGENKQKICKKILKISNYNVSDENSDFCLIYKELSQRARSLDKVNNHSYIKMTQGLLELCKSNPSKELVKFLLHQRIIFSDLDIDILHNDSENSNIGIKYKDTLVSG